MVNKKNMNKYIPIYEYIAKNKTSKQNIYRWIREGKFKKDDIKVEEVVVKRIRIKENAKPNLRTKTI